MIQSETLEAIALAIESQRAVLFLGPNITTNFAPEEERNEQRFFTQMAEQSGGRMRYLADDGFLVFKDAERDRLKSMPSIRRFYSQDFSHPLLEKLLEIPFHLIVSATPDPSIEEVFKRKNYERHLHYCERRKSRGTSYAMLDEAPSANKPLIYQLLGSIKDPSSMVLTHKDLFDYMQALYSQDSLPNELLEAFEVDKCDFVVFLGFDFSKWYYQFILHILDLQKTAFVCATAEHELRPPYDDSYFQVQILEEDMRGFIEGLHGYFPPERLRQAPSEDSRPARKYLEKNIFKLMNGALIQGELETFCMLNYEEVYDNFSPDQSRGSRLTNLFEHVKSQGGFGELIEAIRELNPYQYEQNAPYYEEL